MTLVASDTEKPAQRWHAQKCTRCRGDVPTNGEAYTIASLRYEPMQPGPEWRAVGDWAEPEKLAGTLCSDCLEKLRSWVMGLDADVPEPTDVRVIGGDEVAQWGRSVMPAGEPVDPVPAVYASPGCVEVGDYRLEPGAVEELAARLQAASAYAGRQTTEAAV